MLERVYYWLKIHRFKMPPCIVASHFTSPFEPQNILLKSCYPFGPRMTKIPPPEPVSSTPAGTFPVLRHMFELTMVWLRRFLYFWQPFPTNLVKIVLMGIANRALPILEKMKNLKNARELKRNENDTQKMMGEDSCQEHRSLKSHTNYLSGGSLVIEDSFGEDIEQILIDSSSVTVNNMHLEVEGISELCLISPMIVFDLRNNWQASSGKDIECVTVKRSEHVSPKLLEDTYDPEIFIKELDLCGCLENTLDCLNPNGQLNFNKGLDEILETTLVSQEQEKNMESNRDPPICGKQSLICSLGSSKDEEQPEIKQKSGKNKATYNIESPTDPSSFQSSLVLSLFYSPLEDDEEDDNDDSSEDWWSEDEMEDSSKTQTCSDGNNSGDLENYHEVEEEDSVQKIVFENLCGALSMNNDPFHPLCFSKPIQAHTDCTIASLKPKNHQETIVSSYQTRTSSKLEESCYLPKQSLPTEDQKVERNQETYLCCQPSPRKNTSPLPAEIVSQQEIQVKKKVRFSPVVTVHSLVVWDYASRAARRGPWEEMARDRCRFHRRITQMAAILEPCLAEDHRDKVWKRVHGASASLLEEAADNIPIGSSSIRKEELGFQS